MINAVGRDIPEQILKITGKEVFQGNHYKDGAEFKRVGSDIKSIMSSTKSKLAGSTHDVLVKCGTHDGMTVSFHHHFRDGDKVVNMVMEEAHEMGLKDITICVSSLGKVHAPLAPMIEGETVAGVESSGVRGATNEAVSQGKLKGLVIMRFHGDRVRATTTGETYTDIVFIDTPICDDYGDCHGIGGKANCDVFSYSHVDGSHADKVVAIADCLVPFLNYLIYIPMQRVDHVCVIDEIGDSVKAAAGAAKPTIDQRKLLMAEHCTQVVANTPFFKSDFSHQAGVGGASIASTISLIKIMEDRGIKMGFDVGGLTRSMYNFLERDTVRYLLDTQDLDLDAIGDVKNPNHFRVSTGAYAGPFNRDSFVNELDHVVLAALEVDVNFNCNVVVGSDGVITGAQGGHSDVAAEAKRTIMLAPLLQGRIPTICSDVTTVITPGKSIDVVATGYGVTVNPYRPDLLEALKMTDCIPLKTIQELYGIAHSIVGEPEKVQLADRIVGIVETRGGTIMDVIHQIKSFEFAE